MQSHTITNGNSSNNRNTILIMGLAIGIIAGLASYFTMQYMGSSSDNQNDDTQTGTQSGISTISDYLFGDGSGSQSDNILSGELLTGATGNMNLPDGYEAQFNKALLLLKNDSSLSTFIDTDSLILSGFNLISINPISDDPVAPKITLQGNINDSIDKLYIIGSNNDGAFILEPLKFSAGSRSYELDPNKNNIKPGLNTYYFIGKNKNNEYVLQYLNLKTFEGTQFYGALDKVCILDVCTDPLLTKTIQADGSIIQQSPDGNQVIKVAPDQSISIAKKCGNGEIQIQQVKKIGDAFHKVWKPCDYMSTHQFTQSFVDKLGNPLSDSEVKINLPNKLTYGNIRYLGPVLTTKNSLSPISKTQQIDPNTASNYIRTQMVVPQDFTFELPDNVFAKYALDKSQLKVVGYSKFINGELSAYIIIPKVTDRMNKAIVYTVSSEDATLHDKISGFFRGSKIINQTGCPNPYVNSDSLAKFGLFPVNTEYDVVGFRNCFTLGK